MSIIMESKNVSKHFGGLRAVDNVSTQVPEGSIFGIIGPNGAGKTTYLNLLSGAHSTTSGDFIFCGENITKNSVHVNAKKGIARTFQQIQLFDSMTVLDNVIVGFHKHEKSNMADAIFRTKRYWAEEVDIRQKGLELLERLEMADCCDQIASNLSYGMQRKVEIARALATSPKLLLLDEPAAGMNANETYTLLEFIKFIRTKGYTIIVIEHDIKFILNLCDEIMVLNFGQKIAQGTPAEIRDNKAVIEAYFGTGRVAKHMGVAKDE